MNRQLQLVCIFVFCLPQIVVVILINECYYLCRKDCGESVSLCISYLRVTNSRVELYHVIIHWNQPKWITDQYSLTTACSTREKKNESMKGYNLTNTFSALLITLKRVFALIVVLMMHFCAYLLGSDLHISKTLDGINSLSSVDFTGAGEFLILGMCFPGSEQ